MTCKIVPDMTYNVFGGTLNLAQSISLTMACHGCLCILEVLSHTYLLTYFAWQVEMEDTSMDVMEEKSADNNGDDSASKDDEDDVDPPVMQLNPVWLWIMYFPWVLCFSR